VAQPALSRQIRLLENELGAELLRRTTHSVELTAAGALLLERAPALLDDANDLWRAVERLGTGEAGQVELAYGPSAGYETAPRLLQALAELLPDLKVATRVLPAAAIVAGVGDGTIDAAIVRCPPATDGVEAHVLRRERQGVLMAAGHGSAARETVELAALADETLLVHPRDENPGHYDALLALCRARGLEPKLLERQVAFDLAHLPVAEGHAVTIVGASARPEPGTALVWRPIDPPAELDVHLLVRALDRSPATSRFLATATAVAVDLGWLCRPALN
jgi:DNA-binding transcriptional LysR family regulator